MTYTGYFITKGLILIAAAPFVGAHDASTCGLAGCLSIVMAFLFRNAD